MAGSNMGPGRMKEGWVLCFILGIVMLNYPFLHIFNKSATLFGIPVLILYLFIGWPISIVVIFLFSRVVGEPADSDGGSGSSENETT